MTSLEVQPAQSDDSLIRQVLAGHRDAYAVLVQRYERQVHAVAWAILGDHHTAQDVTQDTFIKAYYQLATLRARNHFGPWLLTIVHRAAIDRARGKNLIFVSTLPDIPTFDSPAESDAAMVLAKLAKLPGREQQILLLRYFEGLPVAEIASALGSSVGTVTKQLSRAIKRLRGHFKEIV